jgi:nicotinate phosphoribosyltransferase
MRNLTLLTDLYQLKMMQGYFLTGKTEVVVFERFYRVNPFDSGYSIVAGLDHVIDYIENLSFEADDIEYLRSLGSFREEFLTYLTTFKFCGDIWSMPEGTVAFPKEPLLCVKANRMEAQLVETAILAFMNHESLIATKASRIRYTAPDDLLMEFGLRRAQNTDAALYGARAAFIGGFDATSNVLAGKIFGIPVVGTMAHSWVMSFPTEIESFRAFINIYPNDALLVVDTYDTLNSGVPNAIQAFLEAKAAGIVMEKYGIRLDSGDLAYLSIKARQMLDAAGLTDAVICASSELDETVISSLKMQGAKVTAWGPGTKLITADGSSSLGGVYKLVAEYGQAGAIPKIKISENAEKVTTPGFKQVIRIYDKATGKITADMITLVEESYSEDKPLILRDEIHSWKRMKLAPGSYRLRNLMVPVFSQGKCIYARPEIQSIKAYCQKELMTLWEAYRRFINPQLAKVDLSERLIELKKNMINELRVGKP